MNTKKKEGLGEFDNRCSCCVGQKLLAFNKGQRLALWKCSTQKHLDQCKTRQTPRTAWTKQNSRFFFFFKFWRWKHTLNVSRLPVRWRRTAGSSPKTGDNLMDLNSDNAESSKVYWLWCHLMQIWCHRCFSPLYHLQSTLEPQNTPTISEYIHLLLDSWHCTFGRTMLHCFKLQTLAWIFSTTIPLRHILQCNGDTTRNIQFFTKEDLILACQKCFGNNTKQATSGYFCYHSALCSALRQTD